MDNRPRLVRSIPFWALVAGSIASIAYGVMLTVDKLSLMETTLNDGTATGVEVYVGQSWAVFGAAFVGAGLVGLVAALAIVTARTLIPRPVEAVEGIAWNEQAAEEAEEPTSDEAESDFDDDFEEPESAEPEVSEEETSTRAN